MSRLPKSRPQRANQRRRGATRPPPRPGASHCGLRQAGLGRPEAHRAPPLAAAAAAARAAAPARPARRRPASAPGLPRLAIDGATEAVKLPLKVSGRLTLKALDAVARGLRGGRAAGPNTWAPACSTRARPPTRSSSGSRPRRPRRSAARRARPRAGRATWRAPTTCRGSTTRRWTGSRCAPPTWPRAARRTGRAAARGRVARRPSLRA